MPSVKFEVADFNLSSSWKYAETTDDVGDVTIDYKSGPTTGSATKSFTISGVDMSTVNSIILSWDISTTASGSITRPTKGWGASYAKIYPGTSASGSYASGNSGELDLTSYVGTNTSVSCFFQYKASIKQSDHDHYEGYGLGDCSSTAYFKNVTLTVIYGEERDDPGSGMWVGVSNVARKVKNIYVGVDGKARKVKAAWVGVGGVARLIYQSIINLPATSSRYNTSGTATTSGTTLYARNSSTGYAGMTFDGSSKFADFTKASLCVYLTGNGSTSITLQTWVRSNADSWINYNTSLGSYYRTNFTDTSTGLHTYYITKALKELYSSNNAITTEGLKVYFRSDNNVKIAGHANTSYQTPYILLE